MNPIQSAMKRFGLDTQRVDAEAVNNLYLLWCSEGGHDEHAEATDAEFRREFGPGATAVVLFTHYRDHARGSLIEYFERLGELDAGHAPQTLASCLGELAIKNAALHRQLMEHLPQIGKAYARFSATGEYQEAWESLESTAWELFDALDEAMDEWASVAPKKEKKAKSQPKAAKPVAKASEEDSDQGEADLEAEIAGLDWSAMARSLVTPTKKSVPAGLEPLLKAFGTFFDQHGEYPTVDELSAATNIKKNIIADVYEELEETFIDQRLE